MESSPASARLAEVVAVLMTLQWAIKMGPARAHVFTDSCVVANGLAVWSGQRQKDNFTIQGKLLMVPPF